MKRDSRRANPFLVVSAAVLGAASSLAAGETDVRPQTQADDYTRYELLDPDSQSFRIYYDLAATTPGATKYFNTIRVGAEPTVHGVVDLATGNALEWRIVNGSVAREGGVVDANSEGKYIEVRLARPVPEGGEARIRIDKTYRDPKSYYREGDRIVLDRTLGIKRNSVVLPPGYELVRCSYPSQIVGEPDGRLKVSFMNPGPAGVPYRVEARPLPAREKSAPSKPKAAPGSSLPLEDATREIAARADYSFSERAFEDREIVYFLGEPKTHAFRLYHDYTESREGVDRYLNVVRKGSRVSSPSARVLDTGAALQVETLRGEQIRSRGIDIAEPVSGDTEVVVVWFEPVKKGQSVRLRIEETYTDPARYLLHGEELVWDRSLGRPRNTVVLPAGWYLTASSIPAVVSETEDGGIRLEYVNDRPDSVEVFIKARRR